MHLAQRRMEKTLHQPQAQPFQNVVGRVVRDAGGKGEAQHLARIRCQRPRTPADDGSLRGRARSEQTDDPVHAEKRHQPQKDADD